MNRITEQSSKHRHLEKLSIEEITKKINAEDSTVALAIEKVLPNINAFLTNAVAKLKSGGRLFYLGAGTGGRLSVLDMIELSNTYGIEEGIINVVLAGGVDRLVEALEEKEDDILEGWEKLQEFAVSEKDIVLGVSASGTTPFVLEGLKHCVKNGITTGCIVNNPNSPIAASSDFPIEVITGTEFITGSTRMKSGTSQKMLFDMISTTAMIQLGRVEDNKMVNVKLINDKLVDRSVKMLMENIGIQDYTKVKKLLLDAGSVKKAMDNHLSNKK